LGGSLADADDGYLREVGDRIEAAAEPDDASR
jgi:hypothetical protein